MQYIIGTSLINFDEKSNTVITTGQVYDTEHHDALIASGVPEITDTEFTIIKRKSVAWAAANLHGEQIDANARTSLLYLLIDPACPQWRKDRILAVQSWWSALWAEYARVVALIIQESNGLVEGNTVFDPLLVGNCPYTIWQVVTE